MTSHSKTRAAPSSAPSSSTGRFRRSPLIREQQLGAFAPKRLRDGVRQAPLIGDAQNQRGLSFQKLRHETVILAERAHLGPLRLPLMYVKGVGPARAAMLEAKGLKSVEDLLTYAPFRYEDRSNVKPMRELAPGEMATVLAEVRSAKVSGFQRRNLGLFEATFTTDASGKPGVLAGKWFHGGVSRRRARARTESRAVRQSGIRFLLGRPDHDASRVRNSLRRRRRRRCRFTPAAWFRSTKRPGRVTTRIFRGLLHRILEASAPIRTIRCPPHLLRQLKLPDRWSAIRDAAFSCRRIRTCGC